MVASALYSPAGTLAAGATLRRGRRRGVHPLQRHAHIGAQAPVPLPRAELSRLSDPLRDAGGDAGVVVDCWGQKLNG
jgi:hypothetical protein